jgi:23S rRNA pseudouridine2605 synthase
MKRTRKYAKTRPEKGAKAQGAEPAEGDISFSKRKIGLARALSKVGYCSRSRATALIQAGKVRLNGCIRRDPETPVQIPIDKIEVDHQPVVAHELMYLILNKPRGVVTTASDEEGRATVYAHLDKDMPWLAPVGRLDKASEGLLLLTNDSEWAARILDPSYGIEKTYHVQIESTSPDFVAAKLSGGVRCGAEVLLIRKAGVLRVGRRNAWLEIVLDEGKNRHIRRMLASLGVNVLRLVRVSIGSLELGTLAKGATRKLSSAEKNDLDSASFVFPARKNAWKRP